VENYFNYFTEIEEHFQRRRGSILLLSTLDWALIETWKDAGVPLAAVLRGIDEAFDHYDKRPSKTRKINSLAYCAQAVLSAAEEMKEAAVGASGARDEQKKQDDKFTAVQIALFLRQNAESLRQRSAVLPPLAQPAAVQAAESLDQMAGSLSGDASGYTSTSPLRLEELEQRLTVLEEKVFAALTAAQSEQWRLIAAR
jgi:hypothetical protein